jgi:hypothetical protein
LRADKDEISFYAIFIFDFVGNIDCRQRFVPYPNGNSFFGCSNALVRCLIDDFLCSYASCLFRAHANGARGLEVLLYKLKGD